MLLDHLKHLWAVGDDVRLFAEFDKLMAMMRAGGLMVPFLNSFNMQLGKVSALGLDLLKVSDKLVAMLLLRASQLMPRQVSAGG